MMDFLDRLRHHVEEKLDEIAILDKERTVAYSELWTMVQGTAARLQQVCERPKVLFSLPQCLEAYVLEISVWYSGGIFCPVHPEAPFDRFEQIALEFEPDVVVFAGSHNRSSNLPGEQFSLDQIIVGEGQAKAIGGSLAYVIYTSGSTGSPKGVRINRTAVNKFLEWSVPTFDAQPGDRWAQYSALSFDLSIVDVFTCLASGATLVSLDESEKLLPGRTIDKYGITIWHSVPSAIDFMSNWDAARPADYSSLKLMSFCGEILWKRQCDFLFKKNGRMRVFNAYGPTEGTLFCAWQEVTSENYETYARGSISIGCAIPGWRLLPEATIAKELHLVIAGPHIAAGYTGQVEVNRFVERKVEGAMLPAFETGDLVLEVAGHYYFSGRVDTQVKVKGYRVELSEIEHWLGECYGNPAAVVLAGHLLVAFIETSTQADEECGKAFLRNKLEPYKVPDRIISISEFPRNTNLKIDRNRLKMQVS